MPCKMYSRKVLRLYMQATPTTTSTCSSTMIPAGPMVGLSEATKTSPTMKNYSGCCYTCSSTIAAWTMRDLLALPRSIKCAAAAPESLQPPPEDYDYNGHFYDDHRDDVAYHWTTSVACSPATTNLACVDTEGLHLKDQPQHNREDVLNVTCIISHQ